MLSKGNIPSDSQSGRDDEGLGVMGDIPCRFMGRRLGARLRAWADTGGAEKFAAREGTGNFHPSARTHLGDYLAAAAILIGF